jgi:hypothetical protein
LDGKKQYSSPSSITESSGSIEGIGSIIVGIIALSLLALLIWLFSIGGGFFVLLLVLVVLLFI